MEWFGFFEACNFFLCQRCAPRPRWEVMFKSALKQKNCKVTAKKSPPYAKQRQLFLNRPCNKNNIGLTWPDMATHHMAMYRHTWPCMAIAVHAWPCMALRLPSPIWTSKITKGVNFYIQMTSRCNPNDFQM